MTYRRVVVMKKKSIWDYSDAQYSILEEYLLSFMCKQEAYISFLTQMLFHAAKTSFMITDTSVLTCLVPHII